MPLRLLVTAALLAVAGQAAPAAGSRAVQLDIEGPIGPATAGYFEKAHRQAVAGGASLVVLRMDTPGGLDTAMRDIVKVILNSPLPVACYVAPGGARAASAGTYILYACHVAAMAPATNLGAATPVPVGGSAPWPGPAQPDPKTGDDKNRNDGSTGKAKDGTDEGTDGAAKGPAAKDDKPAGEGGDAMQHKVVNDAVAYIRSLAEKRGRNADWAERAVREGVSLTAERALEQKVIDVVADDVPALLRQIDGRKVVTTTGEVVLQTADVPVERIEPDWRMKFLSIITSPTVAYILLLIGIYGLLLEGYHPGAILPGVVGAICLLLALYALQLLPVNYVGLGLILLGIVLMIAEALAPSFGALGIGGLVAFVFGSIMLMDIDVPGYEVNRGIIFGIAAGAAVVLGGTLYLLWRARQAPVVTGDRTLLGHTVEVLEVSGDGGWGWVAGERWKLRSATPLQAGGRARIVRMDGLTLVVEMEPQREG